MTYLVKACKILRNKRLACVALTEKGAELFLNDIALLEVDESDFDAGMSD